MGNKKIEKVVTMVVFSDMTQKEIASKLKVTEQTIINWKKQSVKN